jgi:hypothetical protein
MMRFRILPFSVVPISLILFSLLCLAADQPKPRARDLGVPFDGNSRPLQRHH